MSTTGKNTTCTYEYVCSVKKILPQNDKETPVPYKICSFDIEASSSHGDFPLPVKTYKRLATQLVDAIDRQISSMTNGGGEMYVSTILRNSVIAAFGHKTVSGIDCVYPKQSVSKKMATQYADRLLTETMGRIDDEITGSKHHIRANSIQSVFERNASEINAAGGEEEDDGAGAEDDEYSEGFEESPGEEEDDDDDNEAGYQPNKPPPSKRNYTCIDILLGKIPAINTREMKITEITQTLDKLCPPLEGDQVSFIGSTFIKYGQTEPYLNHCLVVGTCDPVAGAVIECASTEREMLMMWRDLIDRENPDIIIGYNIFGFDSEFLFRRSEELDCSMEFSKLSRIIGHKCVKTQFGRNGEDDTYSLESTSVKLASGEYNLRYYGMVGRQQLDLYAYFRRDYNFSSYKLDDVASLLIGDDIKKVEYITD